MAQPPNERMQLPTEEELRELSPQARVAYATRCGLRVLPLSREPEDVNSIFERSLMFCALYSIGVIDDEVAKELSKKVLSEATISSSSSSKVPIDASQTIRNVITITKDIIYTSKSSFNLLHELYLGSSNYAFINNDEVIFELKSDFEDLFRKFGSASGPIDRDFFSKPLWVGIEGQQINDVKNTVSEWDARNHKIIKGRSRNSYWNFFDSRSYGEIPWQEIETEVRDWLDTLEHPDGFDEEETTEQPKLTLNADGAPSSLGSGLSDVDLLGRQRLIESLASMIASPKQDTPFTIGLLGDWGSGKSNVMHLLQKSLEGREDRKRFYFADFNAWQYEHTDNMAAGVAQEVLKGLLERGGFRRQTKIRLQFGVEENGWFIPVFMVTLALIAITSFIMILLDGGYGWIAALSASGLILAGFIKRIFTILEHPLTAKINSYLKLPSYVDHLGTIPMLKRHLQTLCKLIIPPNEENSHRLIVFVDDLDRCDPAAISRTLDAIRLVMDIENVVVIIGIDHRIAFRAVEKQYRELADDYRTSADIARDYLGKIIQLPVILDNPGEAELVNFISNSLFDGVEDPPKTVFDQENRVQTGPGTEISVDETGKGERTPKAEDGGNQSNTESVGSGEKKETVVIAEPPIPGPSQKNELPEEMAETPDEKQFFGEMCKLFKLHNPRQLIRLRNCYRLLKRITKGNINEWQQHMMMLFWLEFLYSQKQDERLKIESLLNAKRIDSLAGCLRNMDVDPDEVVSELKKLFNLENERFELYERTERKVKCMVLPHSESAKKAEIEEQILIDEREKMGAPPKTSSF